MEKPGSGLAELASVKSSKSFCNTHVIAYRLQLSDLLGSPFLEIPILTMAMSRQCPECWSVKGVCPYQWDRKNAGSIPSTRQALLEGLTPINVSQSLSKLNVPELRALYKTHIKGKPHPADPTQGMTSLQKDQLQQLTLEHGLKIEFASGKKFTKGEMMLQLRQHWEDQCLLALQPNQTASVTAESKLPVPLEKDQDQQLRTRNTKRPENPDWEVIPTMVTSPDEKAIIKIKEAEKQVEDAKKIMEAANTRLAVEKQRAGVP